MLALSLDYLWGWRNHWRCRGCQRPGRRYCDCEQLLGPVCVSAMEGLMKDILVGQFISTFCQGHNVTILSFQWCRIFFYHQHSCLERRPQVRVHWRSYICCGEGKLATFRLQVKGVGDCRPRAQRCFACCWACSGSILLLQAGVWLGSWLSQPLWHACAAVCIMSWTCGWLA